MFQSKRHDSSSLLELEAADYFKLDPAQVNMLCSSSNTSTTTMMMIHQNKEQQHQAEQHRADADICEKSKTNDDSTKIVATKSRSSSKMLASSNSNNSSGNRQDKKEVATNKRAQSKRGQTKTTLPVGSNDQVRNAGGSHSAKCIDEPCPSSLSSSKPKNAHQMLTVGRRSVTGSNSNNTRVGKTTTTIPPIELLQPKPRYNQASSSSNQLICSSTTSTNSLPSISSSPSISPSLVCPHLTLDDILNGRYISRSPHTIGLCNRCKLDPPAYIHSPLSPAFRPSNLDTIKMQSRYNNRQVPYCTNQQQQHRHRFATSPIEDQMIMMEQQRRMSNFQRGYSDFQERTKIKMLPNATIEQQDDSLDFYLDPGELKRSQLSPIQRNSVEFIRKYSTEVGRVMKVYKNGQAFEKPLRICITRNEFSNLTQLLDHINSRQLIPCGARYLFHLDGQLVYSVNELKHGSSYIVSGTRNFDIKASTVIKEQQKKELNQSYHMHEQLLRRRLLNSRISSRSLGSLGQLARTDNDNLAEQTTCFSYDFSTPNTKDQPNRADSRQQVAASIPKQVAAINTQTTGKRNLIDSNNVSKQIDSGESRNLFRSRNNADERNYQEQIQSISSKSLGEANKSNLTNESSKRGVQQRCNDDREQRSRSSENLNNECSKMNNEFGDDDASRASGLGQILGGGNLSRAKSELSSSALNKRKKNVTFMDTGQMSSPIMRRSMELEDDGGGSTRREESITRNKENRETDTKNVDDDSNKVAKGGSDNNSNNNNNNNRNEIGIQVSDSIEGFLIDLPLPLPKRGEEKREQQEAQQRRRFVSYNAKRNKTTQAHRDSNRIGQKKIVAITERDLSLDELDQFKDLDHGDHYNELHKIKHVVIKLDSAETVESEQSQQSQKSSKDTGENQSKVVTTITGENSTGNDTNDETKRVEEGELAPADQRGEITSSSIGQQKVIDIQEPSKQLDALITKKDDMDSGSQEHWQYPGGQRGESSATPEERPVSQSEANGAVHARVTTPTPSLSTAGDNNSLSLSYDAIIVNNSSDTRHQQQHGKLRAPPRLPMKNYMPVRGNLSDGMDAPERNFKLTWVNGFTINDLYPDNSATVANVISAAVGPTNLIVDESGTNGIGGNQQSREFLSPASRQEAAMGQQQQTNSSTLRDIQFKPSERFRNWICHSRLHDELIYPAGCIVVLWCRWTNEQRYYSRHLTNISAITLAPTQPDVVASAEIGPEQQTAFGAIIHLWSSTSLETLIVIDEPAHFRGFRIFSMNLKKLSSEQSRWSLSVGSKDDKQPAATLQLVSIKIDLLPSETDQVEDSTRSQTASKKPTNIMKVNRALQTNQIPLLVTHVLSDSIVVVDDPMKPKKAASTKLINQNSNKTPIESKDLLLSFGRRHFQLWSIDWPRQKLQLMQAGEGKSSTFVELITRSNCLARLAPNEFLIGDSIGNITLVIINIPQQQQTPSKTSTNSSSLNKLVGGSPKSLPTANTSKYNLEIVRLVEQQQQQQTATSRSSTPAGQQQQLSSSITSLTRISGSIFASGHSNCMIRFWKIDRNRTNDSSSSLMVKNVNFTCRQLTCISLPTDLGFICSIVSSGFERKQSIVDFYLISTSNVILFGSIKLASLNPSNSNSSSSSSSQADILANSSLSVVYEGHETFVMNLVADPSTSTTISNNNNSGGGKLDQGANYFTCSLDFKICKWQGKNLVWKSMLPSACVSLAIHPTGFVLAIGSADGTVYILDKISGSLVSYFPLTPVCINCLSYSSDGSLLAAGCSNGSIFILPVQENGLKYKKVSIFQSPFPVVSLQFSRNTNRYLLTSVTHSQYQDLILWDLPNFRYMRDNVKMVADKINWFEPVCSGSEDVRAIWENINLMSQPVANYKPPSSLPPSGGEQKSKKIVKTRQQPQSNQSLSNLIELQQQFVVNLSCHRLIFHDQDHSSRNDTKNGDVSTSSKSLCIASDTQGYLRLFRYPCRDIEQAFYQVRVTSSRLNCCRFLTPDTQSFVSSAHDGSIFIWTLE